MADPTTDESFLNQYHVDICSCCMQPEPPLAYALILSIVKAAARQSKLHKPQSGQYISFEGHFKAVKQQFQMAFRAWQKMKIQSV